MTKLLTGLYNQTGHFTAPGSGGVVGVAENYPSSAANAVASGLPEPTHIWTFEETSGPLLDKVGSLNTNKVDSVTRNSSGPVSRNAYTFGATYGRMEAADAALGTYNGQSIRVGAVVRQNNASGKLILSNANPTTNEGYWFYFFSGQPNVYVEQADGAANTSLNHSSSTTSWQVYMGGINLSTGNLEMQTPTSGLVTIANSITDWDASTGKLSIGGADGWSSAGMEITYIIMWTGAAAEADFATTYTTLTTVCPLS